MDPRELRLSSHISEIKLGTDRFERIPKLRVSVLLGFNPLKNAAFRVVFNRHRKAQDKFRYGKPTIKIAKDFTFLKLFCFT